MPLLDHFNPPWSRARGGWHSFHAAWAGAMARLLNQGVLPPGYIAAPLASHEGPIEIDVAALQEEDDFPPPTSAFQPWAPPAPAAAVAVALPPEENVEVQIHYDDGELRLAAAVELLSPRNKDRPAARRTFAVKCVGYLQRGSSVVIVDTVTTRRADIHKKILSLLNVDSPPETPKGLSVVSYRAVGYQNEQQQLQLWPAALALGAPLPTLPLWIGTDLAVPLDLDLSYRAACDDLRIRQAG